MKNIVILISGRGSNMEAIVRACVAEGWQARIAAVISNRAALLPISIAANLTRCLCFFVEVIICFHL